MSRELMDENDINALAAGYKAGMGAFGYKPDVSVTALMAASDLIKQLRAENEFIKSGNSFPTGSVEDHLVSVFGVPQADAASAALHIRHIFKTAPEHAIPEKANEPA